MAADPIQFYKIQCPHCKTPLLANRLKFVCPNCQTSATLSGLAEEYQHVEIMIHDDAPLVLTVHSALSSKSGKVTKNANTPASREECPVAFIYYFLAVLVFIFGTCTSFFIMKSGSLLFFYSLLSITISSALLVAVGKFFSFSKDIGSSLRQIANLKK